MTHLNLRCQTVHTEVPVLLLRKLRDLLSTWSSPAKTVEIALIGSHCGRSAVMIALRSMHTKK